MIVAASFGEDFIRAILQGTPPGTVYALVALGFVVTYRTSGVFNLAFGAQAYVSAAIFFKTRIEWGWPTIWCFLLSVVLVAPLLGLTLERFIFRPLRTASAVAKLVVAVGLTVALPALFELVFQFEAVAGATPEGILPNGSGVFYDPTGLYPWSRNELVQLVVAIVALLGVSAYFKYSASGLAMRAVVESPRMTELAGINADRVSSLAWALSSFFAGLAGVLMAPRFNTLIAPEFFNIMVVAVAAAALGQLVSLRGAVFGGIGLGIIIAIFNTYIPRWSNSQTWLIPIQANLTPSLPFVVLFAVIVLWPAARRPREAGDPLAGVDPPPPAVATVVTSKLLRNGNRIFAVVFLAVAALVVFTKADLSWMSLVTQSVIMSIIFLSITVMTGMGGQISLCQGTFAAIGGFTVFQMAERFEMSVLAAALIGAVIAAVVGALVALPVLKLGGVWLAIATLAFALFFNAVMIKFSWVGAGSMQGTRVPRPTLGPIDFADNRAFLVLAIIVLVVVSLVVIQIREGTVGRTLKALRGSELAAASIGISAARARITAFALSAFIAGIGGALLSIQQKAVNYDINFSPTAGLFWLVVVVTLSARTVEGAIIGGGTFGIFERAILKNLLHLSGKWRLVLFGLTAIQFARHPEGIHEYGKRRSMQKIDARLARRRAAKLEKAGAASESTVSGGAK